MLALAKGSLSQSLTALHIFPKPFHFVVAAEGARNASRAPDGVDGERSSESDAHGMRIGSRRSSIGDAEEEQEPGEMWRKGNGMMHRVIGRESRPFYTALHEAQSARTEMAAARAA